MRLKALFIQLPLGFSHYSFFVMESSGLFQVGRVVSKSQYLILSLLKQALDLMPGLHLPRLLILKFLRLPADLILIVLFLLLLKQFPILLHLNMLIKRLAVINPTHNKLVTFSWHHSTSPAAHP